MAPKIGMVGGGLDALVGAWHRRAVAINAADTMRARKEGRTPSDLEFDFSTAADGLRGLAFIAAVADSDASDVKWTRMRDCLN
jgi:hypothetical protein